jgi:hypothetical protein
MEDASPAGATPARCSVTPALVGLALGVLAFGADGCSQFIGTTAGSFLKRVRQDPDPNIRYLAYAKLAQPSCYEDDQQKAEAVKTLIEKLEKGNEPVASRAVIIHTLGVLGDHTAREAIVKAVSDPEGVIRAQACRALGRVGQPEDATILTRVMTVDTLEDCRIAAIEALGVLKPKDPRITRVLVAGMEHDDPATRLASLNALKRITGRDLGVEAAAWQKILDPQPAPESAIASGTSTPSGLPVSTQPTYPPRLPSQPLVDADARAASSPTGGTAPPQVELTPGSGNYPPRNPNLFQNPAGR